MPKWHIKAKNDGGEKVSLETSGEHCSGWREQPVQRSHGKNLPVMFKEYPVEDRNKRVEKILMSRENEGKELM